MGGKTLIGVGKEEAAKKEAEAKAAAEAKAREEANQPAPADETSPNPAPPAPGVPERVTLPDSDRAGLYSEPTIVDSAKVADALKKLRALEEPEGGSANVSLSVADASSAEVTRVAGPSEGPPKATPQPSTIKLGGTPPPQPLAPSSASRTPPPATGKTGTLWGWMPTQEVSDDAARTPAPPTARAPLTPAPTPGPVATPTPQAADVGRQTVQRSGLLGAAASAAPDADVQRKPTPRPTAIGHGTSAPIPGAAADRDDAFKGTMHGHSLHLPTNAPNTGVSAQATRLSTPAAAKPIGRTAAEPAPGAPAAPRAAAPRGPEVADPQIWRSRKATPPARRKRPARGFPRTVAFAAVVAAFVVVAFAWVRFRNPEVTSASAGAQLPELDNDVDAAEMANLPPSTDDPIPNIHQEPGGPAAPTAVPAAVDQPRGTERPAAATAADQASGSPSAAVEKVARPDRALHEPPRAEGKKVDRQAAVRRPAAAVEPAPRTARPSPPPTAPTAAPASKPAGKTGKKDEDPDGTLPLAE